MRSETDMYHLFMKIADADDRILAVYMNGSRTNVNAPKDIFQDYDIVFVVSETQSFIEDKDWIHRFGRILYMQYPDEHPDYPNDKENIYGWLMQFDDGVRIDLHVESTSHVIEHIRNDKLCRILLDKGNILPSIPEATDADYHVRKPTEAQFRACANEFWWCTNNLAKGLWRKEMPYVQDMANTVVRKQLEQMLSWKVGIKTRFTVSVGKSAKYLYRWLEKNEYQKYLDTYFGGNVDDAWDAVLSMCEMFDQTAKETACVFGYGYDAEEGIAAFTFLKHVRNLPMDATDIGHIGR
ncbi:MAG: aminoglycoside 6-adenylyltransferase [Lachnospiraceae bacterium]